MYDEFSFGPAEQPEERVLLRFVRAYVGALPFAALLGAISYVLGIASLTNAVGVAPFVVVLLLVPAALAIVAMRTMPAGRETGFFGDRLMPLLGDALRSVVFVTMMMVMWGFGIFLVLGAAGMIWTGLRRLF